MKFNVVEVFCEILSGLVLILMVIPILVLANKADLNDTWDFIASHLTGPNVTLLISFSYLLGLIVDSIGFSVGDWFLDDLINKSDNSKGNRISFYSNVSSQVLSYRDTQWTYYSLYRNLFILFIFHAILWSICICIHYKIYQAIVLIVIIGFLEITLFKTMRGLSKLYIEITSSINNKQAP